MMAAKETEMRDKRRNDPAGLETPALPGFALITGGGRGIGASIARALAAGGLHGEQQPDVVGTFYALVIALLDTDALDLAARFIEPAD